MANKPKLRYKLSNTDYSVSLGHWRGMGRQFRKGSKLFVPYAKVKVLWHKARNKHQRNTYIKATVLIDSKLADILPEQTTMHVEFSGGAWEGSYDVYICVARKHVTDAMVMYFLTK